MSEQTTSAAPAVGPWGNLTIGAAPAVLQTREAGPAVGSVVRWREIDAYDELRPERLQYGVVVEYSPEGAAVVLALGESQQAARFAPDPADGEPHGPVVSDLMRVS